MEIELFRRIIEEENMKKVISKKALKLYTPPFRYEMGYIFDSENEMVADDYETSITQVRGWGRISYMDEPEELQDAVGEHIAKALTEYWEKHKND